MRSIRTLALVAASAVVAAAGTLGAALGAPSPYPPGADFTHASTPHSPLFSVQSGHHNRALLVIMVSFISGPFPRGVTPSAVSQLYFGSYPSARDYYLDQSAYALGLHAASESDTFNGGAVNDGVVSVQVPMTKDQWGATDPGTQNATVLRLADSSVDFAAFDNSLTLGNQNGTVDPTELAIARIDAEGALDAGGGGQTNGVSDVVLDGKHINGQKRVSFAGSGSGLNLWIHELAHQMLDADDLYGIGVGVSDLMGPSIAGCLQPLSSYHRLHFGWGTTIPVTHDGYVSIPTYGNSHVAYLFYDYGRGKSDYFLVENRKRNANTYDTCTDDGLVIFRVDDTKIKNNGGNDDVRPISLQTPAGETAQNCVKDPTNGRVNCCPSGCYGGSGADAWDPADPSTPQRTMQRPWRDGTPSNVAVRAILPRNALRAGFDSTDNDIIAYFDVRGPGILVDTFALEGTVATEHQPTTLNVQVRNTGEASDSFTFSVDNLPAGWSAPSVSKTLNAGEDASIPIQLTPETDQDDFTQQIVIAGESNSDHTVRTSSAFYLTVQQPKPELTIEGPGPDEANPTTDRTPTFTFSSTRPIVTAECSFDGPVLAPCSGPGQSHTPAKPLSVNTHTFHITATMAGGQQVSEIRGFVINQGATPTPEPTTPTATPEPGQKIIHIGAGELPTPGDDIIYGTAGADLINAGDGNDIVYGRGGRDRIFGGAGKDKLYGGSARDRLHGGAGKDRLYGNTGRDRLYGGPGNDGLHGGTSNDGLHGGSGKDRLYGNTGRDRLYGGSAKDRLYGGAGKGDYCRGNSGNDKASSGCEAKKTI